MLAVNDIHQGQQENRKDYTYQASSRSAMIPPGFWKQWIISRTMRNTYGCQVKVVFQIYIYIT